MKKVSSDQSLSRARHPELARFLLNHSIMRGEFTLASGRKSSYYCDTKQTSFSGEGAALIADAIVEELRDIEFDAIGGMDMGATPIVSAVAMRLFQLGKPANSFVVRKDVKGHGTKKEVEGIIPSTPGKLVIVDDVVTSAGSMVKSIEVVRAKAHQVVLAISVLDREAGGAEALKKLGVRYQPLVTISEIGISNQ